EQQTINRRRLKVRPIDKRQCGIKNREKALESGNVRLQLNPARLVLYCRTENFFSQECALAARRDPERNWIGYLKTGDHTPIVGLSRQRDIRIGQGRI